MKDFFGWLFMVAFFIGVIWLFGYFLVYRPATVQCQSGYAYSIREALCIPGYRP